MTTRCKAVLLFKSGLLSIVDVDYPPPREYRVASQRRPTLTCDDDDAMRTAPPPEPHRFYRSRRWSVRDMKWRLETPEFLGVTEENAFVYFEDYQD